MEYTIIIEKISENSVILKRQKQALLYGKMENVGEPEFIIIKNNEDGKIDLKTYISNAKIYDLITNIWNGGVQ